MKKENQLVKKSRGRPKIYDKHQLTKHKSYYMLNTYVYCKYCDKWFSMAYKTLHFKTKKCQRAKGLLN